MDYLKLKNVNKTIAIQFLEIFRNASNLNFLHSLNTLLVSRTYLRIADTDIFSSQSFSNMARMLHLCGNQKVFVHIWL